MDTVTESQMAISLASAGGIGIIHKNMSIKEHANQIRFVKKHESGVIREPLTASPGMTVDEIYGITNKYNISGVPVVENNQLVGIITSRDLRFVENLGDSVPSTIDIKNTTNQGPKFLIDTITKIINMNLIKPSGHVGVHQFSPQQQLFSRC